MAILGGLGLLAALALAAVRTPAPRVSASAWVAARTAVIPVGLLWLVSVTVLARPLPFAVAMVSGAAGCLVLWVLRAPPPDPRGEDDDPPGGGPGDDDDPPGRRPARRRHRLGRVRARGVRRLAAGGRPGMDPYPGRSHGFRELLRRPRRARGRRAHPRDLPARRAPGALRRRSPALLAEGPAGERPAQRGRRRACGARTSRRWPRGTRRPIRRRRSPSRRRA